jgi:hypothetical protein
MRDKFCTLKYGKVERLVVLKLNNIWSIINPETNWQESLTSDFLDRSKSHSTNPLLMQIADTNKLNYLLVTIESKFQMLTLIQQGPWHKGVGEEKSRVDAWYRPGGVCDVNALNLEILVKEGLPHKRLQLHLLLHLPPHLLLPCWNHLGHHIYGNNAYVNKQKA